MILRARKGFDRVEEFNDACRSWSNGCVLNRSLLLNGNNNVINVDFSKGRLAKAA